MWGLAAFGPLGIAAAVVGTIGAVAYGTMKDDDYETSTYSNKSEKEAEAREQSRADKKNKIEKEIKSYKKQQIKRLKDKYYVDIKFYGGKSKSSSGINSIGFSPFFGVDGVSMAKEILEIELSEKISVSENNEIDTISILEQEAEEIIKLIGKLEVDKYEATS